MCQVRTAADALIGSATACPACRRAQLSRAADLIAWAQARDRQGRREPPPSHARAA